MAPLFTGKAFGFGRAEEDAAVARLVPTQTSGGTILQPGDAYTYHVFTYPNSDTFALSTAKNVDILVVAGGGGGGNYYGAGGGAGGVVYGSSKLLEAGYYDVQVGGGGERGYGPNAVEGVNTPYGQNGEDSYFGNIGEAIFGQPNYVLARGGGGAGSHYSTKPQSQGRPGGSGGGSSGNDPAPAAGQATQPGTNPALTDYGNPGGYCTPTGGYAPAGGGGAGSAGVEVNGDLTGGGNGGNGVPFGDFPGPKIGPAIPGPQQPSFIPNVGPLGRYGGGGGASLYQSATGSRSGLGGPGGGGNGEPDGNPGAYGTGGGGGGRHPTGVNAGGDGGPGIVIIRYV